jgi:hypothetical protein
MQYLSKPLTAKLRWNKHAKTVLLRWKIYQRHQKTFALIKKPSCAQSV